MGELIDQHSEQCTGVQKNPEAFQGKGRKSNGSGKVRRSQNPRRRNQNPRSKVKSPVKRRCHQNLCSRAKAQRSEAKSPQKDFTWRGPQT